MGIKKIISVSGKGGLFKVVGQTKNGFVVESLIDQKRFPVDSGHRVSMLEDISIYTYEGDVPLKDVFAKIKEKYADSLPVKSKDSADALKKFFREILPDFDEDQVYISDIKKVVTWYNQLKDIIDEPDEDDESDKSDEEKSEEITEDPNSATTDNSEDTSVESSK